ncbi:MAG: XdhC family protein [Myxococcales bacterium]|nr:XdhC family protein [Myxococcales bacterium]
MRDDRDIVRAWECLDAGETAVLGTVVFAEGSTYRRPGARVLILADGTAHGLVSGGCLEADLTERAREVRASGDPVRVRYDATADEDIVWGLGLGCAGVVDVLLEPISRDRPGPLEALARVLGGGGAEVLATVIEPGPDLGHRSPVPPAERARALELGRPLRTNIAGRESLVEPLLGPLRLLVCGAGPDVAPVVRGAGALGWDVTVWDHRSSFAHADRLPEAAEIVCCPAEEASARLPLDGSTAALVMTHHYLHDRSLLGWLLASPAFYVGVLGPKQRTDDLLADLRSEGVAPTESELARLHGPAGLDIGAEGPDEIALALLAEITAVRSERRGGLLRLRKGPIH